MSMCNKRWNVQMLTQRSQIQNMIFDSVYIEFKIIICNTDHDKCEDSDNLWGGGDRG